MNDNITATQDNEVILDADQLENLIRKVIREKLIKFSAQELSILRLNKESQLYKEMEDILECKETGQLKFYTHEEIWNE